MFDNDTLCGIALIAIANTINTFPERKFEDNLPFIKELFGEEVKDIIEKMTKEQRISTFNRMLRRLSIVLPQK